MYTLTDSKEKHYGEYETQDEAFRAMTKIIDELGFKVYYYRQVEIEEGKLWVDYGSHSHFFTIEECV